MSDEPECPYVAGTVTRYCTLTFTLTDAEREAVQEVAHWCEVDSGYCREADEHRAADYYAAKAATLRGLLERTQGGAATDASDAR